jgi:uroporphyrinogen-III decarboxylase
MQGDMYAIGTFVDEWGCVFANVQAGVIGEVKDPILPDLSMVDQYSAPYDILPHNESAARDTVNRYCEASDKFVLGGCNPRPWERLQFLHGTTESMMDLVSPGSGIQSLLDTIHQFYCRELEFWVSTDVDGIRFMDDWGMQNNLLIPPTTWREVFKPLYRDYCDMIHAAGKKAFMHSDGCISSIYEDLVEVGVDAMNSQLFTMDMGDLASRVKGKITFWGEIDRQHILPADDPQQARQAVRQVAGHLYDPAGGVIAQCEFGPGSRPENIQAVFEEWDAVVEA